MDTVFPELPEEEEGRSWSQSPGDGNDDEEDNEGEKRAASSSGLRFVQGDLVVDVPVPTYFESRQMPYFVQPFALNAVEPTKVLLWVLTSADARGASRVTAWPAERGRSAADQCAEMTFQNLSRVSLFVLCANAVGRLLSQSYVVV